MLRTLLYWEQNGTQQTGGEELLDLWHQHPDTRLWLDWRDLDDDAEHRLFNRLGLPEAAQELIQQTRQPSKLQVLKEFLIILQKAPNAGTSSRLLGTQELTIVIGERLLFTRTQNLEKHLNQFWDEETAQAWFLSQGPAAVAIELSQRFSEGYFPLLFDLEQRLGEMEDLLPSRLQERQLSELLGYRTRLRKLRRIFSYHERIWLQLRQRPPRLISNDLYDELRDLHEQSERLHSLTDLYYELAGGLIDGYLSLSSHRLNRSMQVLTLVTVLFTPLTFLAGVYGMNFDNMPELHQPYGYFVLLALMLLISGVQLLWFRKKKWL